MEKTKKNVKSFLFIGITTCFVMLLALMGCPGGSDSPPFSPSEPDITWTLTQVDGVDGLVTSTAIRISFSKEVADLQDAEVDIEGQAVKDGTFIRLGNDWDIPITVNTPGTAGVTVTRNGIEAGTKYVTVHKAGIPTPATWQAVANGQADNVTTTQLTITFSKDVDISVDDVIITDDTGSAEKGSLIGSGTTYILGVFVSTQGTVSIAIDTATVDANVQKVSVYKKTAAGTILPDKPVIGKMEDGLHFTDDVDLSSQAAIDAILTQADGQERPTVHDQSKIKANISLRWTGAGAASYNIYYADENVRPANPQIAGIKDMAAFINNLDFDTRYYVWVEAVHASGGKIISDVRDRTTRGLDLERGDYVRGNETDFVGIDPDNGSLTIWWDLRDRNGWFEVYYAPVGAIPHPDFYKTQQFPRVLPSDSDPSPSGEWGIHAYGSAVYPFCSPLMSNWAGYYIGAVNGMHSDTRPVYGINYTQRIDDETTPDLLPPNAFPYLGESWMEGSHILQSIKQDLTVGGVVYPDTERQGVNIGQEAGLGKLQPYKVLDSRFDHPDVKPWAGTAAGQQGKAYPLYTTSTTITGLQNGVQYEIWIRCPNTNGERGYFYMLGTPGSSGLGVVGNIKVTAPAGSSRELIIEWDSVQDATAYRLYFSSFNETPGATAAYTRILDDGSAKYFITKDALLPSTEYYVWVVAEKNGVAGEKGSAVIGRTGSVPSEGIKGLNKKIAGTNHVVKTLMYVEVNDNNPLNAGSYILEDGAYLVDYVVLFASNIRNRNCALESEPHGCTRNGPHIHHNQNNRHIFVNASKYIKPLQDKGIKVLMGILPDHDGITLGTMNDAERTAFVTTVMQDVEAYGLDGVDLDDEWGSKEDWDKWPNQTTPSPNSIWPYPTANFGWPWTVTVYRDPSKPIGPGNGTTDANISTAAQRSKMWNDLGVGTYKAIQALRAALGPDKVITVYEYNTGRYITAGGVNTEDPMVTASGLAQLIDFSLQPWYNQYIPDSANSLPRSKYGPLAMDVGGGAYATQNGAPNPPMDTTGTGSITDFSTRYKDAADQDSPYGFICLYGLNPSSQLLKRASNDTTATVTKEEYLSLMTEIVFGKKTILTGEGGDYRKDW
jgi:hypothetical protein